MYSHTLPLTAGQKDYATRAVTHGRARDPKWRIALAITIARLLPLVQVPDVEEYFAVSVRNAARDLVSITVETIPFDLEGIESLVESFWKARYEVAFGEARYVSESDPCTLASALGITASISPLIQTAIQVTTAAEAAALNEDLRMLNAILKLSIPENQV